MCNLCLSYILVHLVSQTKLHLLSDLLNLLIIDDARHERLISSWPDHRIDEVSLSHYSCSQMKHKCISNASIVIDVFNRYAWCLFLISSIMFLLHPITFSDCLICLRKSYCLDSFSSYILWLYFSTVFWLLYWLLLFLP